MNMNKQSFVRMMESVGLDPMPTQVSNTIKSVLEEATVKGNVVENVHLLGFSSANGYDYNKKAVEAAVKLYENAPVFLNHSEKSRKVEDKFAYITKPRFDEATGIWGDIVANEKHGYYEAFKWWAENQPSQIGLSHDAFCAFDPDENEITEISKVQSVDLVSRPATVKGLFESFKEGVIEDGLEEDQLQKRFNEVVAKAIELIEREWWAFDPAPIKERAETIKIVAEDLTRMMQEITASSTQVNNNNLSQEGEDMKWEDIDFKALEENRPDLVTKIRDDHAAVIAQRQKKLEEALKDVPEELRSELFVEQVTNAVHSNNSDLVIKLVEDRKSLAPTPTSSGVVGDESETHGAAKEESKKDDSKTVLEELAM